MNWEKLHDFEDIIYEKCDGIAKVTINRPHRRNSFTPDTVSELIQAFNDAREDTSVGVVLLTGFNPQSDGRVVRINIPPLSTDVRKKMVARIKELSEEAKVSIRNIRRDGNKAAEQAEKDKEVTEDQRDDIKDDIQKLTKEYEDQVNAMAKDREKEVMDD